MNSGPLATEPELLTTFLTFSEPRPTLLKAPGLGSQVRRAAHGPGSQGHSLKHLCPPAQVLPVSGLISWGPDPPAASLPPSLNFSLLQKTPHPITRPARTPPPLFYPSANSWGQPGAQPARPVSWPPCLLVRQGFLGRDRCGSWFTSSHPCLGPVRPQGRGHWLCA